MFTRRSRYYRLPETVATDRNARRFASKVLRPHEPINGRFLHTLDANDRLDHLAYKFYKQSLHWWRICDANAAKSPRELLDNTPFKKIMVQIRWLGVSAPWSELFSMLRALNGVESIVKGTASSPVPIKEILIGASLFSIDAGFQGDIQQSVLSQVLSAPLNNELAINGLTLVGDVKLYALGDSLWQLHEIQTGSTYLIRLLDAIPPALAMLNVAEAVVQYDWFLEVCYNEMVIAYEAISDRIEDLSFQVRSIEKMGRAGKSILIPARFIG